MYTKTLENVGRSVNVLKIQLLGVYPGISKRFGDNPFTSSVIKCTPDIDLDVV